MPYGKRTMSYIRSAYRSRRQYRKMHGKTRLARSILAQGGVPGGATRMSPPMSQPAEVKFRDSSVVSAIGTGDWQLVLNSAIQGITQTAGNGGRIGRSIKIVGITYRLCVNYATLAVPYSIDIGFDKQANSAVTPIADIYTASSHTALPNPVFERRYKFLKRLEYKDPNLNVTYQCGTIKCAQVVNFGGSTGTITDMEDANLFVNFACAGPVTASSLTGIVRINYIDY